MDIIGFKNKNATQIGIIAIITTLIMALSSIVIYSNVSKPKFYDYFMEMGNKYLNESKYEESILAFNKAIHIEPKSTEARVQVSKAYIGNNQPDKAIDSLKEAQSIDIENVTLLLEILEILKDIDSDVAYEILQNYINKVGKDNISDEIKDIVDTSNESPKVPIVNPLPGTYVTPISIKLQLDEIRVGHSFYYTIDGSEPSKSSKKYAGAIEIDKDTEVKIIGYNKKDEATEIISLKYIIDTEIKTNLDNLIKESESLADSTEVGTDIGNVVEGAKEEFLEVINEAKQLLGQSTLSYNSVNSTYSELKEALDIFKSKIIEPTDKTKLKSTIDRAQKIYNNSTEGNQNGQFKIGSKNILLKSINEAKKVHDDISSKQNDLDNAVNTLEKAINVFEKSKVTSFNKDIALRYVINKYGEPFDYKPDYWVDIEAGKTGQAINSYRFDSDMLIENGLRYYRIAHVENWYGDTHVFINGLKVYEDGSIQDIGDIYGLENW